LLDDDELDEGWGRREDMNRHELEREADHGG
jgi:hypothetical protein